MECHLAKLCRKAVLVASVEVLVINIGAKQFEEAVGLLVNFRF